MVHFYILWYWLIREVLLALLQNVQNWLYIFCNKTLRQWRDAYASWPGGAGGPASQKLILKLRFIVVIYDMMMTICVSEIDS